MTVTTVNQKESHMDIVIKRPKTTLAALIASSLVFGCVFAKPDMYGNFPVTEKSYSGKKRIQLPILVR